MIVPHNLTNKIQRLDLSVNKAVESFIQNKYSNVFDNQVSALLSKGTDPNKVKTIDIITIETLGDDTYMTSMIIVQF